MSCFPEVPLRTGPRSATRAAKEGSIRSSRIFLSNLAVFLFVTAIALPLPAQEERWEELSDRAAALYREGKYAEAELLYQRALAIREKAVGPDDPDVAISLNNLAELYRAEGKYADAEPLFRRSLGILEKVLGPDHPGVATALNNLAELYRAQGKYAEAEPLFRRALAIDQKALGPEHPDVARDLNNLAQLYNAQGKSPRSARRARSVRFRPPR